MFIRKLVAAAFIAVAATGIAAATGHGQGTLAGFSGQDGPVAYTTSFAADHSSMEVTLASGKFVPAPDAVAVVAEDGTFIGAIPLRIDAHAVAPRIDASGTVLTLTPVGGPSPAAVMSQDLPGVHEAGGPITIGVAAGIGCVIGAAIGIWFFIVGAFVGCAVGAAIGATVGFFFIPGP